MILVKNAPLGPNLNFLNFIPCLLCPQAKELLHWEVFKEQKRQGNYNTYLATENGGVFKGVDLF